MTAAASAWASDDLPTEHWVQVEWEEPIDVSSVVIHWADRLGVSALRKSTGLRY